MDSQVIANLLMDIEQKKWPYANINNVDILSDSGEFIEYRVHITSRIDPKWVLSDSIKKINISEIITEIRDDKLKILLED